MAEPIAFRTTRYRCPTCPRTASSKARMVVHIGRCWTNPEARGCKTCKHFEPYGAEHGDGCAQGVNLSGRPACPGCGGTGWAGTNVGAETPCGPERSANHVGDGSEVRAGPIIGCERWESADG